MPYHQQYSTTLDSKPKARRWPETLPDRRSKRFCTFRFGTLAWETSNGQVHAHFKPGLEIELSGKHIPFGNAGPLMEPDTLVISYLTALEHDVSDPTIQLAKSTAPLPERIQAFLQCFNELENFRRKPLLISYDWFEEAASVKRRVLAQGGDDHSFFDDLCTAIDNAGLSLSETHAIRDEVRNLFLLDQETFTFWVGGIGTKSSPHFRNLTPLGLARSMLEQYQGEPPHTWKRELYDMREQVFAILRTRNKVTINNRIRLLEFTNTCSLWKEPVLLGTPIV